jgi:hypothetical protein
MILRLKKCSIILIDLITKCDNTLWTVGSHMTGVNTPWWYYIYLNARKSFHLKLGLSTRLLVDSLSKCKVHVSSLHLQLWGYKYKPLPSAPGVDDSMQQCKQQSVWDENILQELCAESIKYVVKDLFQEQQKWQYTLESWTRLLLQSLQEGISLTITLGPQYVKMLNQIKK